ncbi:uncharacterized protein SCHCODRAFT_02636481 [Schizophyllum commune H4-8]|uniref:uncharacterized protein n=1 Tax=Schizophyllum commune (strain H4-8 / FGSC 9210) TaxID=578458 RepID=UPI002160EC47|nr:uncharacterized protein SCHCODRAFT_02636481 [Schizophyllum commune H4-8]KAI5888339.1 hypothetical protein SCHCODRAFT_02636481 [Schizophyllum commune H4-8]
MCYPLPPPLASLSTREARLTPSVFAWCARCSLSPSLPSLSSTRGDCDAPSPLGMQLTASSRGELPARAFTPLPSLPLAPPTPPCHKPPPSHLFLLLA